MNIGIVSTIKRGREKGDVRFLDYQDSTNQEDSRSSITSVHDSLHLHLRSETVFMLLVAIFMDICYVDVLVDIMVDIFRAGVHHVATLLAGMHLLQNYSSKEARPAQE